MSDHPSSASIRFTFRLTPSFCLALGGLTLSASIIIGGQLLAAGQQAALDARANAFAGQQEQLLTALQHAILTAPRLRLEELAALPLVAEFVQIAHEDPESTDTQELRDYLQTVLSAAIEETGLSRIVLVSESGEELIAAEHLLSSAEDGANLEISASVESFSGSGTKAGHLAGYLPERDLKLVPSEAGNGAQSTAGIADAANAEASGLEAGLDIPASTRLLSLAAGLVTALTALLGAALLKRQRAAGN